MRLRLLIPALALVVAACSAPASSDEPGTAAPEASASAASSADPAADAIEVSVLDFMLDPSDIEVAGPTVTFDVTNDGPTPHNFTVRDDAGEVLMATEDLSVDGTETISGELEPGTYTVFCSLPGHESLGMSGTLTVTGG
ncbi:MAG: cupredoxin domain-containing protein [Chloroflexi bacterium]|nr:cupredoxin domain-containing protein [Chloroflexota bacterium]